MRLKIENAFGKILQQIRKNKNISQEKLAFASDLDRTYISLLERGHRQPTLITIFKLAKALSISPTELIRAVEEIVDEDS